MDEDSKLKKIQRRKKMKNRTLLLSAIIFLAIASVYAFIPPPPANQNIGFYDTAVNQLTATTCHNAAPCHGSDDTAIANRHHLLVPNDEWNCQNCHPVDPDAPGGYGVVMERDCIQCHNGTAWTRNPGEVNISRPHHNTTQAQNRQCGNATGCHGAYVDNYDDGHYVPPYPVSLVTPNATYNVYNATSGRYWGGCWACHQENSSVSPIILSNANTHHNELIEVTGGPGNSGALCTWCHGETPGQPSIVLGIRYCEQCHSVATIHNIQYNYANNGPLGYGHINNNWDCWGCHAFWDAGVNNPFAGPVVPDLTEMSPAKLAANVPADVTIKGTNFIQDPYDTTVSIDGVSYTPKTITNSELVVTVPALNAGIHEVKLVKGGKTSQTSGLVVVPLMGITSAKMSRATITIEGTGFNPQPDPSFNNLGVFVTHEAKGKTSTFKAEVTSWSDTQIVVSSADASTGDLLTVKALYGEGSATITGDTTPKPTRPKPIPKPK
jgi:hypothetical protein